LTQQPQNGCAHIPHANENALAGRPADDSGGRQMFEDLVLADYSGTEPVVLAIIVIVLAALGVNARRQEKWPPV